MLNNEEKKELKELVQSSKLRQDLRRVRDFRHNPFMVNGNVDIDRLLVFLTEYNSFINHKLKPFHRIIDNEFRL